MNICKPHILILTFCVTTLNCNSQNPLQGGVGGGIVGNLDGFYWWTTIAFSAINGTTTYFNIKKLNTPDKYKENAIVGILSGAAQTAIGFGGIIDKNLYAPATTNIGFGLTTVVTSIIRLANKRPPKEDKVTFNFFYLPPVDHHAATCGLRVVGRLN